MSVEFDLRRRIRAFEIAASAWLDRDTGVIKEAIWKTLEAPNSFTPAALYAGIDRAMSKVTVSALQEWVGDASYSSEACVAVLNAGNVPFVGLQDFLAVLSCGKAYVGITSRKSPHLLPAFAASVRKLDPTMRCRFTTLDEALPDADALIATGSSATVQVVSRRFAASGVSPARQLLRGTRMGVALLTGTESRGELRSLASDVLLHEGRGCRSVAVVLAPFEFDAQAFVEETNRFRLEFPAHENTRTAVGRAAKLLSAVGAPFIQGDGFLLIEDDVALREPCVVRWLKYVDRAQPLEWLNRQRRRLQVIVGAPEWGPELPDTVDRCDFGEGQNPPLAWSPDGLDTVSFVRRLEAARL